MKNRTLKTTHESGEKRGDIRHTVPRPVEFFARGKPFIGTIVNQSRGGLFIETRGKFQVGDSIFLLDNAFSAGQKKRKATIVRVAAEGIGIVFQKPGYY